MRNGGEPVKARREESRKEIADDDPEACPGLFLEAEDRRVFLLD